MKYCSNCKTEQPKVDFYKNASTKDGLAAWCKPCMKTNVKIYNKRDKKVTGKFAWHRSNK